MIYFRVLMVILTVACCVVKGQNLCGETERLGNIGYRFHESLCNEYIQCHNDNVGNIYAVYMSCPYGQHWDQTNKVCADLSQNSCLLGTCVQTSRLKDGGCRAYSTCDFPRTYSHQCCREGYRYTSGGCVPDYTCTDPCPGECVAGDAETCRSYPHWSNPTFYYHYHVDENRVYERICPRGSHYDMVVCGCVAPRRRFCFTENSLRFASNGLFTQSGETWTAVQGVPLTDGEASFDQSNSIIRGNIVMGKPTEEVPLVIRLGYRRLNADSQLQTLFLSNDCKGCNQFLVGVQSDQFIVKVSKDARVVAELSMSTAGFNQTRLVDAAVVYNGRELLAIIKSENMHYMQRTKAPQLTVMDCGMQISDVTNPFRGRLQYIAIYTCHQGGRMQSLFNLPTFPVT